MATHNDLGSRGEELAAEYLQKQGYLLRAKNFRYQHTEIDLIAEKDRTLIFVEVKTRKWLAFGLPETFVSASKVKFVKKAAEHFIFSQDWKFDVRFDIISILIDRNDNPSIHHIEDAFC